MITNALKKLESLDKSNWKTYRFDQIAQSIGTRVDPTDTDLEVYVGLEHLDSESLHIQRTGHPTDVKGSKLRFYPGDIIFGRRRAYQRKAAIATFDGICSAHALVLRAIPEIIDPQLFPFFIHSDTFMNRAIDISVGSLSPTINWRTLKQQEFLLPPKDQQAQLAELLWAMDKVVEKNYLVLNSLQKLFFYSLNYYMVHGNYNDSETLKKSKCGLINRKMSLMTLKDCLSEKPQYGANASAKDLIGDSPRYIRITDIDDEGQLIETNLATIDSLDYDNYLLKENDFLFARTGNTVGKSFLYEKKHGKAVFAGYLIKFVLEKEKLNPKFLYYYSKSLKFDIFKYRMTKIGAQPNINSEEYQSMLLPDLPIHIQNEIVGKLDKVNSQIFSTKDQIEVSKALQKSLINEVFS